jgi:trimeric autotransporter adhesin
MNTARVAAIADSVNNSSKNSSSSSQPAQLSAARVEQRTRAHVIVHGVLSSVISAAVAAAQQKEAAAAAAAAAAATPAAPLQLPVRAKVTRTAVNVLHRRKAQQAAMALTAAAAASADAGTAASSQNSARSASSSNSSNSTVTAANTTTAVGNSSSTVYEAAADECEPDALSVSSYDSMDVRVEDGDVGGDFIPLGWRTFASANTAGSRPCSPPQLGIAEALRGAPGSRFRRQPQQQLPAQQQQQQQQQQQMYHMQLPLNTDSSTAGASSVTGAAVGSKSNSDQLGAVPLVYDTFAQQQQHEQQQQHTAGQDHSHNQIVWPRRDLFSRSIFGGPRLFSWPPPGDSLTGGEGDSGESHSTASLEMLAVIDEALGIGRPAAAAAGGMDNSETSELHSADTSAGSTSSSGIVAVAGDVAEFAEPSASSDSTSTADADADADADAAAEATATAAATAAAVAFSADEHVDSNTEAVCSHDSSSSDMNAEHSSDATITSAIDDSVRVDSGGDSTAVTAIEHIEVADSSDTTQSLMRANTQKEGSAELVRNVSVAPPAVDAASSGDSDAAAVNNDASTEAVSADTLTEPLDAVHSSSSAAGVASTGTQTLCDADADTASTGIGRELQTQHDVAQQPTDVVSSGATVTPAMPSVKHKPAAAGTVVVVPVIVQPYCDPERPVVHAATASTKDATISIAIQQQQQQSVTPEPRQRDTHRVAASHDSAAVAARMRAAVRTTAADLAAATPAVDEAQFKSRSEGRRRSGSSDTTALKHLLAKSTTAASTSASSAAADLHLLHKASNSSGSISSSSRKKLFSASLSDGGRATGDTNSTDSTAAAASTAATAAGTAHGSSANTTAAGVAAATAAAAGSKLRQQLMLRPAETAEELRLRRISSWSPLPLPEPLTTAAARSRQQHQQQHQRQSSSGSSVGAHRPPTPAATATATTAIAAAGSSGVHRTPVKAASTNTGTSITTAATAAATAASSGGSIGSISGGGAVSRSNSVPSSAHRTVITSTTGSSAAHAEPLDATDSSSSAAAQHHHTVRSSGSSTATTAITAASDYCDHTSRTTPTAGTTAAATVEVPVRHQSTQTCAQTLNSSVCDASWWSEGEAEKVCEGAECDTCTLADEDDADNCSGVSLSLRGGWTAGSSTRRGSVSMVTLAPGESGYRDSGYSSAPCYSVDGGMHSGSRYACSTSQSYTLLYVIVLAVETLRAVL